jgi:hypothetical protein
MVAVQSPEVRGRAAGLNIDTDREAYFGRYHFMPAYGLAVLSLKWDRNHERCVTVVGNN